jgi:thiol-disulfide isomerase/thioredoxin
MRNLFLTCFLITAVAVKAQQNNFRITGSTPKDISSNLYLLVNGDTLRSKVANRTFVFEGHVDEPAKVTLKTDNPYCGSQFFIEPGEMTLTSFMPGRPGDECIIKQELKGSPTQDVYESYSRELTAIREKYSVEKSQDKIRELVEKTIAKNPSSVVSADLIVTYSRYLGAKWTKSNYDLLSDQLKNSKSGLEVQKTVNSFGLMKKGNYVLDFEQRDIHDSSFHLSSLKGQYVLIDFWASWCGPCRKENPNVKKVYDKYHAQGFEIVSVSLDNDANQWKQAVEKDKLNWIQISDLKGWENEIAKTFHINGIPTNILLDKEGKIIATNLRGNELERQVSKLF